ncbi:MAG: hypothetical protein QXF22_05170 [Thermoplasmata archaeon]
MYYENYYTDGIKAFEDFKKICKFLINWTFKTIQVTFEYQDKKITVIKNNLKDIAKQMRDRGIKINIPKTTFPKTYPNFEVHVYGYNMPAYSIFLEGSLDILKAELRKARKFCHNQEIHLDLFYYLNKSTEFNILSMSGERNLVFNKFIKDFKGIDTPLFIE